MLRKILFILSGNATASLLSLVRNLLVARLLSVEDYGIAATFAVVMALLEMASSIGLQVQIVQSDKGDDPKFQAGLQGFNVLRGVVSAIVLFFGAPYVAAFLKVPELAWAYQVLALAPLFLGFLHFDVFRFNRAMRFGPMMVVTVAPTVITLLMVWPLIWWLEDWRVMLVIVIAQPLIRALASHIVADRPYGLSLGAASMASSVKFGWPLMINNILLFLVMQGDRALVMRELGPADLAVFSLGLTLTMTPASMVGKSLNALFLPVLSKEADPGRFQARAILAIQAAMLNASILVLAVFALGELVVLAALGDKYAALVPLLGAFAALSAMRILKNGSNVVAISRAHTANAMISNIFRVLTLPIIWLALHRGAGFETVILLAFLGEATGYLASVLLVWLRVERRLWQVGPPLICTVLLMAITTGVPLLDVALSEGLLWSLFGLLLAVQAVTMAAMRKWVVWHVRRLFR